MTGGSVLDETYKTYCIVLYIIISAVSVQFEFINVLKKQDTVGLWLDLDAESQFGWGRRELGFRSVVSKKNRLNCSSIDIVC